MRRDKSQVQPGDQGDAVGSMGRETRTPKTLRQETDPDSGPMTAKKENTIPRELEKNFCDNKVPQNEWGGFGPSLGKKTRHRTEKKSTR